MQILDMGSKVYVTATVVGVLVGPDKRVSYRVNVPGLGNFNCPAENMNEVGNGDNQKTGHWEKIKIDKNEALFCSQCHEVLENLRPTRYCASCGAYMAGPKNKEDETK